MRPGAGELRPKAATGGHLWRPPSLTCGGSALGTTYPQPNSISGTPHWRGDVLDRRSLDIPKSPVGGGGDLSMVPTPPRGTQNRRPPGRRFVVLALLPARRRAETAPTCGAFLPRGPRALVGRARRRFDHVSPGADPPACSRLLGLLGRQAVFVEGVLGPVLRARLGEAVGA